MGSVVSREVKIICCIPETQPPQSDLTVSQRGHNKGSCSARLRLHPTAIVFKRESSIFSLLSVIFFVVSLAVM